VTIVHRRRLDCHSLIILDSLGARDLFNLH